MLRLRRVAITGALSSGKSSVCRFFKDLGAHVISADEIVHNLLTPETEIGQQVIALFQNDVVSNGKIDRSKIAECVFQQSNLLKRLEEILHPAVHKEIEKHYEQAIDNHAPLFVAEIPLLFEIGEEKKFDCTIAVRADPEESFQRFHASTGYEREEYERRMARQISQNEKCLRADVVIENKGSLKDLQQAVVTIYHRLTQSI